MKKILTAAIAASFLVAGAAFAADGAHEGCPHHAAMKAEQAKAGGEGQDKSAKAACDCKDGCDCAADKAGCGCKAGEGCPHAKSDCGCKDGKACEGCTCAKEGCGCKDGKACESCAHAKDGCGCKGGEACESCAHAKDGKAGCKHAKVKGADAQQAAAATHTCPMHPKVVQKGPGKCPDCGMDLVKQAKAKK
ncbi:MAG: heavy metal-binding domain-containing protein [Myxococcales bacterium]|jgi:hypothetical protein